MREILFRGQTRRYGEKVNMAGKKQPSEWVYGGIFPSTGVYSVIYGEDTEKYIVYSDTVGQYTGKSVETGKVFEGDIGYSIDGLFLVCWDEEKAAFVMRFYSYPYETLYLEEMWDDAKIIGNIHDNPELLKGESDG